MIHLTENKVHLTRVCKKLNVISNNAGKHLSLHTDFGFFFYVYLTLLVIKVGIRVQAFLGIMVSKCLSLRQRCI